MRRSRFVVVIALVASGCAIIRQDDIQEKYTSRVRQIGLSPVYPPREELQVGDLAIISEYPGKEKGQARIYLSVQPETRRKALKLAQAALDSRLYFGATKAIQPGTPISSGGELISGAFATRGAAKVFGKGIDSLPSAVFPSITAEASGALNAGLLRPLQAFGLFVGQRTTVTLNFHDVRTYAIPTDQADALFQAELCYRRKPPPKPATAIASSRTLYASDEQSITRAAAAIDAGGYGIPPSPDGGKNRRQYYSFISRVYLTRQIDYTYSNRQLVALAKQRLAPGPDGKAPAAPQTFVQINLPKDGAAPAPAEPPKPADTAVTSSTFLLDPTTGQNGVAAVSYSGLGVTISQVFERPVAIAYEGVTLDYAAVADTRQVADVCLANAPTAPIGGGGGAAAFQASPGENPIPDALQ